MMPRPFFHALPFKVLFASGGYRTFKHFEVFNAYLLALEDQGHRWTFVDENTARLELVA